MGRKLVTSDEMQINLDSVLDAVAAGNELLITHNEKNIGVIVSYAQWQQLKKLMAEEIAQIRRAMDNGAYVTWEIVKADLKAAKIL